MDDGLKQRLVGAGVVCAIAVILLPSLFQRTERRVVDRATLIPPRPVVQPVVPVEPEMPATVRELPEPETVFTPDPDEDVSPQGPEQSGLDAVGLAKAWVVQVASFVEQDRAEELTERLTKMGYKAYIAKAKTGKGVRFRVNVGPQVDKNDAITTKAEVDKALRVNALVLNFHP